MQVETSAAKYGCSTPCERRAVGVWCSLPNMRVFDEAPAFLIYELFCCSTPPPFSISITSFLLSRSLLFSSLLSFLFSSLFSLSLSEWFHFSCINLTDEKAATMTSYACGSRAETLQIAASEGGVTSDDDAVYCICRRPEVAGEEMIQCDDCAVSVLATTAVCPKLKALAGRSS